MPRAFRSNMGDKKMYIDNGIRGLAETKGCRIEAISDYLITEPYGVTDQDEFLNGEGFCESNLSSSIS